MDREGREIEKREMAGQGRWILEEGVGVETREQRAKGLVMMGKR